MASSRETPYPEIPSSTVASWPDTPSYLPGCTQIHSDPQASSRRPEGHRERRPDSSSPVKALQVEPSVTVISVEPVPQVGFPSGLVETEPGSAASASDLAAYMEPEPETTRLVLSSLERALTVEQVMLVSVQGRSKLNMQSAPQEKEEFLFALIPQQHQGWNPPLTSVIARCSYKSCTRHRVRTKAICPAIVSLLQSALETYPRRGSATLEYILFLPAENPSSSQLGRSTHPAVDMVHTRSPPAHHLRVVAQSTPERHDTAPRHRSRPRVFQEPRKTVPSC